MTPSYNLLLQPYFIFYLNNPSSVSSTSLAVIVGKDSYKKRTGIHSSVQLTTAWSIGMAECGDESSAHVYNECFTESTWAKQ